MIKEIKQDWLKLWIMRGLRPIIELKLNSFSYYANGRAILHRGNNKHISGGTTHSPDYRGFYNKLYLKTGWCCRWYIAFAFLPAGVRRCEKASVEVINVGGAMLLGNTTCRAQGRRCWILSSNNNGPREGIAGHLQGNLYQGDDHHFGN